MVAKVWKEGEEGGTPITAAELNRIEETLDEAAEYATGFKQYGVSQRDLGEVKRSLNRRVDEVDEKADGVLQAMEAGVGAVVSSMESDFVAKSDLEQSIVDIVQKRFGIEPKQ